jgi:hypothetical protein
MKPNYKYQTIYFYTYRYYLIFTSLTLNEIISGMKRFILTRVPNLRYLFKSKLFKSIISEYSNRNFINVTHLVSQLPKSKFDEEMFFIAKNSYILTDNKAEAQRYLNEYFDFMGIDLQKFMLYELE